MRSSKALGLALFLCGPLAHAQQPAQGFAVERLYPSAPGAGWFVMDTLDTRGRIGGIMAATLGYSASALRVADSARQVAVVSDNAFASFGVAVTFLERFRGYLDFTMPLAVSGESGVVGSYQFAAPNVSIGNDPDVLSDARVGFDARIVGQPHGPFRLGAGGQLFLPSGTRAQYDSDNTYRGMLRLLAAGDVGQFTYAAHLGVHIRPLDDTPIPGSPQGSELLFGVAAGARCPVLGSMALVVGPEIYGASAFRAPFGTSTTALEGLLGARLEGTGDHTQQFRIKLGVGAGLNPEFGAPTWRIVFGVEVFVHDLLRTKP